MSPTALVVLVVAGPLLGRWLADRRRLTWTLFALSLMPVAALTFVPVDREVFARCTFQWALPTPGRVELMANLVLFVAPALLATVATRRPLVVLLGAVVGSAAIEALQAAVTALGRSCDSTDWSSNAIGAAIGVLLGVAALRLARPARR